MIGTASIVGWALWALGVERRVVEQHHSAGAEVAARPAPQSAAPPAAPPSPGPRRSSRRSRGRAPRSRLASVGGGSPPLGRPVPARVVAPPPPRSPARPDWSSAVATVGRRGRRGGGGSSRVGRSRGPRAEISPSSSSFPRQPARRRRRRSAVASRRRQRLPASRRRELGVGPVVEAQHRSGGGRDAFDSGRLPPLAAGRCGGGS